MIWPKDILSKGHQGAIELKWPFSIVSNWSKMAKPLHFHINQLMDEGHTEKGQDRGKGSSLQLRQSLKRLAFEGSLPRVLHYKSSLKQNVRTTSATINSTEIKNFFQLLQRETTHRLEAVQETSARECLPACYSTVTFIWKHSMDLLLRTSRTHSSNITMEVKCKDSP